MTKEILLKKVNGHPVQIIEVDGQKIVPIKPICDALGIDFDSQRQKINQDEILGSTTVLSTAVGADGKQREMVCLPLEFVFGWLFTINPNNVKEEARSAVIRYKYECYHALYMYFYRVIIFLEEKDKRIAYCLKEYNATRYAFYNTKKTLAEQKAALDSAVKMELETFERENAQLKLEL